MEKILREKQRKGILCYKTYCQILLEKKINNNSGCEGEKKEASTKSTQPTIYNMFIILKVLRLQAMVLQDIFWNVLWRNG